MLVSDRPSRTKRLSAQRRISRFEGGSASARRNAVARIATPWLAPGGDACQEDSSGCTALASTRCFFINVYSGRRVFKDNVLDGGYADGRASDLNPAKPI